MANHNLVDRIINTLFGATERAPAVAEVAAKPRSVQAQGAKPAMTALDDDGLIRFVMGKHPGVAGVNGGKPFDNVLFRGNDKTAYTITLQQSLNRGGEKTGGVDGDFAGRTERAVRNVQRHHGLAVDGLAGRVTVAAQQVSEAETLFRALNKDGSLAQDAAAKTELAKELTDIATMKESLPASAKAKAGALLKNLKSIGKIEDTDAVLGQSMAAVRQAVTGRSAK